jgi:hypothetical protein
MPKKILLYFIILLLFISAVSFIIYKLIHNSKNPTGVPVSTSQTMFGLALQNFFPDTRKVIDLSKLKGKITCFWNWSATLPQSYAEEAYSWNKELNMQFIPMLWSSDVRANTISSVSNYNYVMLSNEPDMIGGCVGAPASSGFCINSTSSGYWTDTGEYGCFTGTDDTSTNPVCTELNIGSGKNTFSLLVTKFISQCAEAKSLSPNVTIVSPVMSQNASGTCNAYKTIFDPATKLPIKQIPLKCGDSGCTCNGWLSLLKTAALSTSQGTDWWKNTVKIINIHAYFKYSHHVKSKILDYMKTFQDDMNAGKKIWLTEVAYVSTISDTDSYITEAAAFAKSLLYTNTTSSSAPPCEGVNNLNQDLPGLLTNTPFLFNGKSASWFDHGLTCVTWFCVKTWPNFTTGCNGVTTTTDQITSYPFDDTGSFNELGKSLFQIF